MKRTGLLLTFSLTLLLALAACTSSSTTIIFENHTICGTIQIELTNTQDSTTATYQVPMGETVTIEVVPEVLYNYVVDYSTASNGEQGFRCMAVQRGEVTAPSGSSTRFGLTAVTPTPSSPPDG